MAEDRTPATELELDRPPPPSHPGISAVAILGAVLLVVGVFCPVIVTPAGATRSYYDLPWVDANIVLGASVVAFVLTWVFRWYRGLFVVGGLSLFILGATLIKLSRSEYREAALTWGWLPLTAGVLLLLVAAIAAERVRPPQREAEAPEDPFDDYE